ncbi:uncharacterized protein LAESUDRAFT_684843 [Laetiporus sulphureus 93-53]|uniref:Cora-domain-containing protein n=1 Tax=Laetiporus sulphureus 93-53 TaxID=1314785 RepID=A0A165CE74_9APHY|nr:uncharacterized protein LAESUDRAFT_684843 [Laetiporus sulphureus 93-53]KZT02653.1 hypothetical protein LAESUDRAFT_684843 [Laetiporus sulphureus 93-53]
MHTADFELIPIRAESDDSDRTVAPSEPSRDILESADVAALVAKSHVDRIPLEVEEEDIYRGEEPSPPRCASPDSITSSSSSSVFPGRLGAISAVLEHAIATWARAWASSSSISTSSSSSASSIVTMTRSQMARRRRRRKSQTDLRNQQSEREVAARIKAREESRIIPRAFDLYVPSPEDLDGTLVEGQAANAIKAEQRTPILHTDSLPFVISRLGSVLRDHGRARRTRSETAAPVSPSPTSPFLHHSYMMPYDLGSPALFIYPNTQAGRRDRKGKRRAGSAPATVHLPPAPSSSMAVAEKAWWLDVSSPTWEDMRAIGKLLHLHPLTLEDILQQDPREKLELFPKLGYYFIAFRAIESEKTRERIRARRSPQERPSPLDEGIVGEVNVYMIVFRGGICSFHFADIGEHVEHVRHKILQLSGNINMSSDWIAHGIMDSIVDSFFPFLKVIEREVDEIETLMVSDPVEPHPKPGRQDAVNRSQVTLIPSADSEKDGTKDKIEIVTLTSTLSDQEPEPWKTVERKTQFVLPKRWPIFVRRFERYIREVYGHFRVVFKHTPTVTTTTTVHRMARTRRLVISLARFLDHKHEVVAQLQKRLLTVGEWRLRHGTEHDQDVYIYMGDVQDHILTLQQSLAHYERVLSQAHPIYLSHLRLSVSKVQSGTDTAVVTLTTVSLGVVCVQTLIGLFSMNVLVPSNDLEGNKYNAFAVVIALSVVIILVYAFIVRQWWVWAKQKRRTRF